MKDIEYLNHVSKEDKILIANIIDKYKSYQRNDKESYSNFLNERELKIVTNYLNHLKIPYSIYKPYDFLEKTIIYFGNYYDYVTIYKVKIKNNIKHPDILGSLFSIGLNENTIGDILVDEDCFYYTNLTRFNNFLEDNLYMIKNERVKLEKTTEIIIKKERFETIQILIPSMRLDNVSIKLSNEKRKIVNDWIASKKVLLNYEEAKSTSMLVHENDVLSIRKVGKFIIGKTIGNTKKNKLILEIKKYCWGVIWKK